MSQTKIAVIGAGSYVFGPAVLEAVFLEHRLRGVELALMDVGREIVEHMAAAGNRIASSLGLDSRCTAHTTRDTALDGADYIICAAARDMRRRFNNDRRICRAHDPKAVITEFGGVVGISYSIRQIALFEEICADIRRYCPRALLLNSANPLPRVCQAAHQLGVHTVGLCSVSYVGVAAAWKALRGEATTYPFTAARTGLDYTNAGVNHLAFLVSLRDARTREDLLPSLRQAADRIPHPRTAGILTRTGYLISSGDEHSTDFLPPDEYSHSIEESSHGSDAERQARMDLLKAIAAGTADYRPLFERTSWERPVDVIVALQQSRPTRFAALNLVNSGQLADLPAGTFVETPASVSTAGIAADRVSLPEAVTAFCRPAAELSDLIVRAALQRSRKLLADAVDADPTIVHKPAAHAALAEILTANADILPPYA